MKRQAGYTLLELLVVVVIMALVTAAIPGLAFPVVASMRLSGKLQGIIYQLSTLHEKAAETGEEVIVRPADLDQPGLNVTSTSSVITFFPDGSASAVVLSAKVSGRRNYIYIDPITGRAKVL